MTLEKRKYLGMLGRHTRKIETDQLTWNVPIGETYGIAYDSDKPVGERILIKPVEQIAREHNIPAVAE